MTKPAEVLHENYPDNYHDTHSKTVFGFWLYLLSDFILFAALFATYVVLHKHVFGGPSGIDLFNLPIALTETLILLMASFTSGLAGAFAHRENAKLTILFFLLTFCLGIIFLGLEGVDFARLVRGGSGWDRSAFLSSYFTLVGTHSIHMLFALFWVILLLPMIMRFGISSTILRRVTCLRMFWQFLNIVWVFIFTIVYLMEGV